jgi:hypothetical protein
MAGRGEEVSSLSKKIRHPRHQVSESTNFDFVGRQVRQPIRVCCKNVTQIGPAFGVRHGLPSPSSKRGQPAQPRLEAAAAAAAEAAAAGRQTVVKRR